MEPFLENYKVEIEEDAFQKTRRACLPLIAKREIIFEEHLSSLLLKVLLQEMKYYLIFAPLCLVFFTIVQLYSKEPYACVAIISVILGVLSMGELVRSYYYHMEELQHPTKIGISRLFLYKVLILSIVQLSFIAILIALSAFAFQANIAYLLLFSVLPCFLLPGLILQIVHKLPSLYVTIALLILLFMVYMYMVQFMYVYHRVFSNQIAFGISFVSLLFYLYSCFHLQRKLNRGGIIQWNS